jgi:CheY-like chemotaxis protein
VALIAVADDDHAFRQMLKDFVTAIGHEALEFMSGQDTLDYFVNTSNRVPALLILDVMMPGMDGYAVYTKLQEDERTRAMPVVILAPLGRTYEKVVSNLEEVKARQGVVIAVASDGDRELNGKADYVLHLPYLSEYVAPILEAVPLQLLAYHIAVQRGCDVDQPRNLAKSVTVE